MKDFNVKRIGDEKTSQAGFTLVEVAVVIIILSLVFVPLFSLLTKKQSEETMIDTGFEQDRAVSAINFFLKQYGRYPCPSDATLGPGNAAFGLESCNGVALNAGVLIGALPTASLGLPYHLAANKDGWKYIYAVTETLSRSAATFDGQGAITVRQDANSASNGVRFVVVDPGKDGKGARSLDGGAGPACGVVSEDSENCNGTAVFRDTQIKDTGNFTDAGYFDDVVAYDRGSEKSDFWVVKRNSTTAGRVELTSRSSGDIGFGGNAPAARVDVGGDMRIEADDNGIGGDIETRGDLEATSILANSIETSKSVLANSFCVGWSYKDSNNNDEVTCCTNGKVYRIWDTDHFKEFCGQSCANGQYQDKDDVSLCCPRVYADTKTGKCNIPP